MTKVALHSGLLMLGLLLSSRIPTLFPGAAAVVLFLTTTCLSLLLIQTGLDLTSERSSLAEAAGDWLVASLSAACPWLLVSIYFLAVFLPTAGWNDSGPWLTALLSARFAATSSVGLTVVLLAAAGGASGWLSRKARGLAMMGNVAAVLFMLPLKIFMMGFHWQMAAMILGLGGLLALSRWGARCLRWPVSWPWRLTYAVVITALFEEIHQKGRWIDDVLPLQIEVLLPAFVLGCLLKRPATEEATDTELLERRSESWISGVFIFLAGCSMPSFSFASSWMNVGTLAMHVLWVTALASLGRLFLLFCYRKKASFRERLGLCIALGSRGEIGAGMLLISIGYGVGGAMVIVAVYSLALNLLSAGLSTLAIRRLMNPTPPAQG